VQIVYSALLEEARFFGIDRLEKWLSEKKYLEAVKIVYSVAETDNLNKLATTVNGDVEIVYHHSLLSEWCMSLMISSFVSWCRRFFPHSPCLGSLHCWSSSGQIF
jgi:hypothetical protein